jgi:hypothetical protein
LGCFLSRFGGRALAAAVGLLSARGVAAEDAPAETATTETNPLPKTSGFQLGARLAMAHPGGPLGAGPAATTPTLDEIAQTWVPIGIDGGYRFTRAVYAGLTLAWGPLIGDQAALCGACNFRYDFQVKPELRVYLAPEATVGVWLSIAPGWEVLHLSLGDSPSGDATYQGPFGEAELGLDIRLHAFAMGPYLGAAVGGFLARSLDPEPPHEPSSFGVAAHEWFSLGVRGSYGPY